jgi:endonuclease YncB( thermonuclease family)
MVFVLWPVTIPLGFGEVWWASRQAQPRSENSPAPALKPKPTTKTPEASPALAPHAVVPNPAEQKQAPAEQTNAGQAAALKESDKTGAIAPQAAAPQAATKLYHRVAVRDGGTLQAGKVVIRLGGIAARKADATCKGADGKVWRCGAAAKAALTRFIRGRAVTCTLPKSGEHNIFVARCLVGGTDLSAWVVRQGWAESKDPALAQAAKAAKDEHLGLWRADERSP